MTGVLIAVRHGRESELAAAIGSHPELTVARRCADLGEALGAAQAGVGAVAIVSEQAQLTRATVAAFREAGVALVGAPASPLEGERLLGLGIATVVAAGAEPADVADATRAAAADAPSPAPAAADAEAAEPARSRHGAIVAVWGPTGAPGRTTLAVNLAAELASPDHGCIVVDLDTYGGAVAQALGLQDESPGMAAVARAGASGSSVEDAIARHALAVAPGLRVLSGITRPSRWPELSAAALEPAWPALRAAADVTVVDCGFALETDEDLTYDTRAPQRNDATLAALSHADVVVAVGSAEPLAVQRLVHALAAFDERMDGAAAERVVVVNRVRSSVAGARPHEAVADALARFAGVPDTWILPYDAKAADAATLAGQTLRERAPRSPLRKAIAGLAAAVGDRAESIDRLSRAESNVVVD